MSDKRKRTPQELHKIRQYYTKKKANSESVGNGEEFPHFRDYKPSNHPALVIGEADKDVYDYRQVSHGDKKDKTKVNGRKSLEVYPNPKPNDFEPMRISMRVRCDYKNKFGDKKNWSVKNVPKELHKKK